MRKGYRNCDKDFNIDSIQVQFNFNVSDRYLKVNFFEENREKLAPIERVIFFLKDQRKLEYAFIVNGELCYFYEKKWYYNFKSDMFHDGPSSVPKHIFERFNFQKEDVLLIKANNNPKPPIIDIWYWLAIYKYDRLDSTKAIEKNIFIKEKQWKELPAPSDDDLYRGSIPSYVF